MAGANLWLPVDDNYHPQRGHTRPVQQLGKVFLGHNPQLSHRPSLQASRFQRRPAALTLCNFQVNSCLCVATSSSAFSECCGIFFFPNIFHPQSGWRAGRAHRYRGPTLHGIGPKKEFSVPSHEGKGLTVRQEAGKGYGGNHLEDESRGAGDHACGWGLQLAGDAGESRQTGGCGSVRPGRRGTLGRSACPPGAYPLPAPSTPTEGTSIENLVPWHSLNCYRTCMSLLFSFKHKKTSEL